MLTYVLRQFHFIGGAAKEKWLKKNWIIRIIMLGIAGDDANENQNIFYYLSCISLKFNGFIADEKPQFQ